MSSYRFARRPWWIVSHLLLIAAVVLMVNLGFWQLRRLHEKQDRNALAHANEAVATAPIEDVPIANFDEGNRLMFRSVTATGTYDTADEIIIRSRSQTDRPGVWVVTPLRLDDGSGVVVVRGFLPSSAALDTVPPDAAAPTGRVTISGYLQGTQTKGLFGPSDPAEGHLTSMARVDIGRIAKQVSYPLYPAFLTLTAPANPDSFPEPVPKITLDEGPHLSYAVQWFLFSTVAVVGYPFVLRRRARQGDKEPDPDEPSSGDEDHEPAFAGRP